MAFLARVWSNAFSTALGLSIGRRVRNLNSGYSTIDQCNEMRPLLSRQRESQKEIKTEQEWERMPFYLVTHTSLVEANDVNSAAETAIDKICTARKVTVVVKADEFTTTQVTVVFQGEDHRSSGRDHSPSAAVDLEPIQNAPVNSRNRAYMPIFVPIAIVLAISTFTYFVS